MSSLMLWKLSRPMKYCSLRPTKAWMGPSTMGRPATKAKSVPYDSVPWMARAAPPAMTTSAMTWVLTYQ